ncbi:MAG: GNAT family N-acetyltransferase [Verrucomicrobiaceae bacterium]|nr:MAG: GNAT family N-acetyltransferase [Verrucomicrobiaceae bacterium]
MKISELTIDHYDEVMALFRQTPGVSVRDADSKDSTARYLERNPGLSFVAEENGEIIGCAMCGHDGRRGYLQHVVVYPPYRGRGIAHALVSRCLDGLEKVGILKVHIDVLVTNHVANAYWTRRGWARRDDIHRYSFNRSGNPDA